MQSIEFTNISNGKLKNAGACSRITRRPCALPPVACIPRSARFGRLLSIELLATIRLAAELLTPMLARSVLSLN